VFSPLIKQLLKIIDDRIVCNDCNDGMAESVEAHVVEANSPSFRQGPPQIGQNVVLTDHNKLKSWSYSVCVGYANEVGESFRALIHVNWVRFSYVVASSYVCADAASKGTDVGKVC